MIVPPTPLTPIDFKPMPYLYESGYPDPCFKECQWGMRRQDGRPFFVHVRRGQFSMLDLPHEMLRNLDYDVYGLVVAPWIERLHRDQDS